MAGATEQYLLETLDFISMAALRKEAKAKLTSEEVKQMFKYYNYYYASNMDGYWCSSCRATVYKGLIKLVSRIKNTLGYDQES